MVGESGCGKSVTWLAALGLLPAQGARHRQRASRRATELLGAAPATLDRVRGGRVAMIFQDPASSLNPVHRSARQVAEALRAASRHRPAARARAEAKRLLDQVGIPDAARRLDAYPHELSGGQNQRVMIAMALAGEPELLVADEPTTALDVTIQAQILDLLHRLAARDRHGAGADLARSRRRRGDLRRVAVMYAGRIVEQAPADRAVRAPAHPYTRGLLGALPPIDGPRRPLAAIPGGVPEPWAMPPGCAFAPRCAAR